MNQPKKLGVQIFVEVPNDVWPQTHGELDAILKSFATTSTKPPGK